MIYIYRLCLTLFESNTNIIHNMFLFIFCSELSAIQEIAKIGSSKNWKAKEKNAIRQQITSLTQLNASYGVSITQWHFLGEWITLRHFSAQVFLACFSSSRCPILKVQSWLNCWTFLSSIGFSRIEMPFNHLTKVYQESQLGQILNCCVTGPNVTEGAFGSSPAGCSFRNA